jgi:hypothetical protein
MKTCKGLRGIRAALGDPHGRGARPALGGRVKTEQSLSRVHSRPLPPRLAIVATIALAILASLMLVAASCSVARL